MALAFILFGGMSVQAATAYFLIATSFREAAEKLSGVFVSVRNIRGSADKFDRIGAREGAMIWRIVTGLRWKAFRTSSSPTW